jgi:CubicO group peptidase (beta-lactamase class C family)
MQIRIFLVPAVLFALGSVASASPHRGPFPSDKEIQQTMDDLVSEKRTFGILVETRSPDGTVRFFHAGSAGRPGVRLDRDSVFEIGSVTKTFTAALLADMVLRGELQLEDPVANYLPITVTGPKSSGRAIQLVDLATHYSALPFVPTNLSKEHLRDGETQKVVKAWREYSIPMFYEFLSNYRLPWRVGGKFQYSNVGFALLANVEGLRLGETWEDAVRQRILRPLRMNSTSIEITNGMSKRVVQGHDASGHEVPNWDVPALPGFGTLHSTADDLMRYLVANLRMDGGAAGRALALTHVPRRKAFGSSRIGLAWDIGAGANPTVVWHGGGTIGCSSFVGFDPANGAALVILANTSSGGFNDIGLHFLDQRIPSDESPSIVALCRRLDKIGYGKCIKVVAAEKRKNSKYSLPEQDLNALGYRLIGQQRIREGMEVFKLAVQLYPTSYNAYDSLGEAYEDLGNRAMAIRNYRWSLHLNPRNTNAVQHLESLNRG